MTKKISFPRSEWAGIKQRLRKGLPVYTIRVSIMYGKYKPGDILKTGWGETLKVKTVNKIASIENYKFYSELNSDQKKKLAGYNKIDVVKLVHEGIILKNSSTL